MTSPLIEACTITELEAFLDIKQSQLYFSTTFAETTLSFWKETEFQTDSDLLRRLQQVEDEVYEKKMLDHIDNAIQKSQRIYLPAREKESTI